MLHLLKFNIVEIDSIFKKVILRKNCKTNDLVYFFFDKFYLPHIYEELDDLKKK